MNLIHILDSLRNQQPVDGANPFAQLSGEQMAGTVLPIPKIEIVPRHNSLLGTSGYSANAWGPSGLLHQGTGTYPTPEAARAAVIRILFGPKR